MINAAATIEDVQANDPKEIFLEPFGSIPSTEVGGST
jgi:hypothetical protein